MIDSATLQLARLWENLLQEHREQNLLSELKRNLRLHPLNDVVARVRYMVTLYNDGAGEITYAQLAQELQALKHPLAEAYRVQYGGTVGDLEHHKAIVARYVDNGEGRRKLKPDQVLFDGPVTDPLSMEACIRLYFGVGISLVYVGRIMEGKNAFLRSKQLADVNKISSLSINSEIHVAMTDFTAGNYSTSAETFARLVQQVAALDEEHLEDQAYSTVAWSATMGGLDAVEQLKVPEGSPFSLMMDQFKNAVFNSSFMPIKGLRYDMNRMLEFFTEGRKMSFSARKLDIATVQEQAYKILDMHLPERKDSMSYLMSVFVKCHAYIHLGMFDNAVELAREELSKGKVGRSETAQIVQFIIFAHAQTFAGDQVVVPEVAQGLRRVQAYLKRQNPFIRRRIIDFGCRGMPNVALFMHHAGVSREVPEVLEYLEQECVWVKFLGSDGSLDDRVKAFYKGKEVVGYPKVLGDVFARLFSPEWDESPGTVASRKTRLKNALNDPKEYPPQVFDAMVLPVLDHLRTSGVDV